MFPERTPVAAWRPTPRHWLLAALLVLLLAAAFRLVALPDVPPGLAQDEILDADIALFIRGGEHALFFRHGYGHEPLYHYLASPFAPLLGDNWLAIRLPSVYLGLLLVALTLRWARRDFGATAALVAGLGLAASWWPVIFSRIGIRPVLEPALLVMAALCWPLCREILTRRGLLRAGLAGLFLGLAMYSYTAARVAPLIPALVVALMAAAHWLARRRSEAGGASRAQVVYATVVLALCGLVYLPLGLTLRANPELQQRLEQLEGPLTALRAGDAGPVEQAALATLGVFSISGDPRWTYSPPGRPLFDPLTALLFYGGLLLALWRWRRPSYALALAWLAVTLLPSALSPDAPSTVRLVGALPVVYLLPGLAIDRLVVWTAAARSRRGGQAATWTLMVLAGVLLAFSGYRTVRDGFVRWPAELETRLRYQTALRDIGRAWLAGNGDAPVVAEVFFEPIDADSLRRVIGRDPAARWVQTGGGVAGALVWPAGQTAARLYVPEYAPLDGELAAAAGLGEPIFRSPDAPSFAVYVLPDWPTAAGPAVGESFGEPPAARLEGFTLLNAGSALGEGQLRLVSSWQVLAALPADLTLFVHLLDKGGAIVAQHDGLDAAATTLRPGDRLLQRHVLSLPALSPGEYRLVIGLYRHGDGLRLPSADGTGTALLARCAPAAEGLDCDLP